MSYLFLINKMISSLRANKSKHERVRDLTVKPLRNKKILIVSDKDCFIKEKKELKDQKKQ